MLYVQVYVCIIAVVYTENLDKNLSKENSQSILIEQLHTNCFALNKSVWHFSAISKLSSKGPRNMHWGISYLYSFACEQRSVLI